MTHRHFIIHKPVGYVSQFVFNQTKRKNKKLLGLLHDFPEGTMHIGRLDKNSEGLLLLTTDGNMSERVRSKNVEKEYYVEVDDLITDDAIETMRRGLEISIFGKPYHTLPSKVVRLNDNVISLLPIAPSTKKRHRPTSWISVILTEGKFRQVRKMTAGVGFPTLRLVRIRVGDIRLGQMQSGEVREVDLEEWF